MATIRFEEVKIHGRKRFKDAAGKTRTRSKTFMATINPFNKNESGVPKTRSEILYDLQRERDAWLQESEATT